MDRVADCFVAASRTRVPFWFFFSFDMRLDNSFFFSLHLLNHTSSIPSETKDDVHLLCSYLENFGQSERMLHYAHGLLVSTFAGERSSFQQPTLDSAWSFVKERLSSAIQSPVCISGFFIRHEELNTVRFIMCRHSLLTPSCTPK